MYAIRSYYVWQNIIRFVKMINNKSIAVVVPAYNEETQISEVIHSMPEFVDRIIIVNDFSTDKTEEVVKRIIDSDSTDYTNNKIGFVKIIPTRYNEAEVVLQQIQAEETKKFTPFSTYNKSPEKNRIILINHLKNGGVGAAIATGYKWCYDNNIDCTAVMAGDGQMDPGELVITSYSIHYTKLYDNVYFRQCFTKKFFLIRQE